MTDPHRAFRMSVYQALTGLTDLDGNPVSVYDEVAENPANVYILLSTQTNAQQGVFGGFLHSSTILLQVVDKEQIYVSKDVIDDISTKIMNILLPQPNVDGLVQQPGIQINCLQAESLNSNDASLTNTQTVVRKLLRLSAKIAQL